MRELRILSSAARFAATAAVVINAVKYACPSAGVAPRGVVPDGSTIRTALCAEVRGGLG